ncbi:MAG TPA: TIGR03435 family protein [Candidatus Limnocylindrales bacterium]|nr:TIGR03435 family protein [Candidatus Limnocylindrales bacterium]
MPRFLLAAMVLAAAAQTPATKAPLEFEVASVKHTVDREAAGRIVHLPGEVGYRGNNAPLMLYLQVAYQIRPAQIVAPEWVNSELIDVEAKAGRTCTADELHEMLQHLLEERFHMKLHRETRMENGYALVVDNGAPKLKDHDPEDHVSMPITGFGPHTAQNVTMQYFAFFLSQEVGQTVVDKTGLTGHYDFEATWYPDPSTFIAPPQPPGAPAEQSPAMFRQMPSGPTVFDALKKQLGLRLEKTKVPVDHLVIDSIDKLTEN